MPKSRTLPSRSKAHVLQAYRSRGRANRNLWLVYSEKTKRDWILGSDRHLVHWVKFLEVNPNVRSFAIEPEGIQVPREADRAAKNIDATAELRNGEHEHHVLDLSATFRQENSSSVLADYPSNVGLRIFSESDLFPLGAEAMRWLKLINYCAAIRNEDHKEAAIACIATMRKLDGGTLGQVLDVLSNFDSQIVIGVFSRMVIQNDIAVDLSSASFSLASEWTWRCAT